MASTSSSESLPPDQNLGTVLLVLTSILTAFSIITTGLRIWARHGRGLIGWDDITIGICCLLAMGRTTIQIISVFHGNGRHRHYLSIPHYEYVNFLTWMTQLFLFTDICLLKCSICLLILRIKDSLTIKRCLYTMMAGLVVTNLLCVVVLLAECSPVKKYWVPITPGYCWNTKIRIYSIYAQVGYSVITDFICALLPVLVLWKVNMDVNLKWAVCGLMSLGLVATSCGIVRATSLSIVTTDLSWAYCIAAIWGNTELHLGIIATNLSLARSIYGHIVGHEVSVSSGRRSKRYSSSHTYRSQGWLRSPDPENATGEDYGSKHVSSGERVPLGPVVLKTTEFKFHIAQDGIAQNRGENENHIVQKQWSETPKRQSGKRSSNFEFN